MARTKLHECEDRNKAHVDETSERESGIQLAVPRVAPIRSGAFSMRPTERPTVYMQAVRFQESARRVSPANEQGRPGPARTTLRVRLTPYAREHAVADGQTDDTPASFLRHFASIGSIDSVPYVRDGAPGGEFDDRELRLLALLDGVVTLETVLDRCRMPAHCALRILCDLSERGVVAFR
jgi:hypothetical protein